MKSKKPTIINGQVDVSEYLNWVETQVRVGNLALLIPDSMHKENTPTSVARRYLDQRSGEIFRIKGRNGGPGDQHQLTKTTTCTKTTTAEGHSLIESNYSFRDFKPPLFGDVTLQIKTTPQLTNQYTSALTIDLSQYPFQVTETVNIQLVEAVVINAIARSFTFRRSQFSNAVVTLTSLRVHHIDTGFGAIEYAVRRCIDQAFDDGTQEPTVSFDNGLTIKNSGMRFSGALAVEIIGRLEQD